MKIKPAQNPALSEFIGIFIVSPGLYNAAENLELVQIQRRSIFRYKNIYTWSWSRTSRQPHFKCEKKQNKLVKSIKMELLIASSSVADAGIGCWDLESGAEQLRYKSCASPPHGLACVGQRFLASSQLREQPSASSGSILYWSWSKVAYPLFVYLPQF